MKGKGIFMALLSILLFVTYVSADMVTLKSGQKIEGKIMEMTDKYVKIDFQGVVLTYYQEEIASIAQSSSAGPGLNFKPAYLPVDFAGFSESYPAMPKVKEIKGEYMPEITAKDPRVDLYDTPQEALEMDEPTAGGDLPVAPDLSALIASLPPQQQEMIKHIQANPQDISGAISSLPKEQQGMLKGIMKDMPQMGAIKTGEEKE